MDVRINISLLNGAWLIYSCAGLYKHFAPTGAFANNLMKTLIKNGRVITATDDYKADILIEDERVSVIGAKLEMEADKVSMLPAN